MSAFRISTGRKRSEKSGKWEEEAVKISANGEEENLEISICITKLKRRVEKDDGHLIELIDHSCSPRPNTDNKHALTRQKIVRSTPIQ